MGDRKFVVFARLWAIRFNAKIQPTILYGLFLPNANFDHQSLGG
jgi:hypothetical protein